MNAVLREVYIASGYPVDTLDRKNRWRLWDSKDLIESYKNLILFEESMNSIGYALVTRSSKWIHSLAVIQVIGLGPNIRCTAF